MAFRYEKGRALRLFRFSFNNSKEQQPSTRTSRSTIPHQIFRWNFRTQTSSENNRLYLIHLNINTRCHSHPHFQLHFNSNSQRPTRNHNLRYPLETRMNIKPLTSESSLLKCRARYTFETKFPFTFNMIN